MNKIKKVLSAWMLVACVLPVAAQYPVIPDSAKERGAKQEAEFEQKIKRGMGKSLADSFRRSTKRTSLQTLGFQTGRFDKK